VFFPKDEFLVAVFAKVEHAITIAEGAVVDGEKRVILTDNIAIIINLHYYFLKSNT
jgi:hypothetical protein